MEFEKEKEIDRDAETGGQNHPACRECGRIVKPESSSWREDDAGAIYCRYCRAERESCGCSD
jgi:hypothetical protein